LPIVRLRDLGYLTLALLASPILGWRLWRTGKWRTDWAARFGRALPLPAGPRTLLLHGVSLGEINATRPLVAALREADPALRIVISATTETGMARARALYAPELPVVRFPFDFSPSVARFLDAVRPDAVALMELELWPTFLDECGRRGIPVAVVNGRLSARSFGRYRRVRRLVRPMFQQLALAAAQTSDDAERFATLGAPDGRIRVVDNLKWEVRLPGEPGAQGFEARARTLRDAMGIDPERPLVVAGSTTLGEERRIARSLGLGEKTEGMTGRPDGVRPQLLVAPRHPERFDEVAALFPGCVRRSGHPDGSAPSVRSVRPGGDVFLLDTLGELTAAYALADVVLVGRSFVPGFGGSDPIEPAALGKAVVIGPDHVNFREIVSALVEAGGIRVADDPGRAALDLLADPEARQALAESAVGLIRRRRGAAGRTAEAVLELLPRE